MFVLSKRNVIIPAPDGSTAVALRRDVMTNIPEWAAQTNYFQALVRDGKIVPTGTSDKEARKRPKRKSGRAEARQFLRNKGGLRVCFA